MHCNAFLSTPSGWRATVTLTYKNGVPDISIHALRVEGDWSATPAQSHPRYFYPRPPGGGRRTKYNAAPPEQDISIHALRVEGDPAIGCAWRRPQTFLSTPSGWRATAERPRTGMGRHLFLSTPSGWRATSGPVVIGSMPPLFLSTPSGWRATATSGAACAMACRFLSTPSGWRATLCIHQQRAALRGISIHALRVEGDNVCSTLVLPP